MNQQQIIQIRIATLDNELQQIYSQRQSHQAKVADFATPTGNAAADKTLQEAALVSANSLVMLDRMIETRVTALDTLTTELTALNAASPATAPAPRPADPPLVA